MRDVVSPAHQSVRPHVIVLSLLSDERLARLAAGGDSLAFSTIYQRYHGQLYRYCRSIVGSPDDAADALQNAMLAAFRSLQGEIRSIRMRPWLYKIAHNESVSILRQRQPVAGLDAAAGVVGADMALDAAIRERLRQVMSDVAQLSERQRGALLMRELNGLDYQEIGAALGTSVGAAKQSVHEARMALADVRDGRDMECESVRTLVSERDGRQLRGRGVRAHLESCRSCAGFRASIVTRRGDLAAFIPVVPATTAAAVLKGAMGGAAVGEAGGIAAFLGGGSIAGAAAAKGAAIVALAATVGVGTFAYVQKEGEKNRSGGDRSGGASGFVAPPAPPAANREHKGNGHPDVVVTVPDEPDRKTKAEIRRQRTAFVAQVPGDPPPLDRADHDRKDKPEQKAKAPAEDESTAGRGHGPGKGSDSGQGAKGNDGGSSDPVEDGDDSHGHGGNSGEEPEYDLPDNLDDLLAGDLADLIDHYSGAYLAGNFDSSDINDLIERYTAQVKDYTGAKLAEQITSSLNASGINSMLEKLTGGSTSGSQTQNFVSRLIPNLSSFLP